MARTVVGISEASRRDAHQLDDRKATPRKATSPNYKNPGNDTVAKQLRADLQSQRSMLRQRLKVLKGRFAKGHGYLPKVDFEAEGRTIHHAMSRIGMYLKWIKDWLNPKVYLSAA